MGDCQGKKVLSIETRTDYTSRKSMLDHDYGGVFSERRLIKGGEIESAVR